MKYLVYLSATKVKMMYWQLPRVGRAASSGIGFDLRVVKGDRRVERQEPSIYEKLQAVEDWIHAEESVGSLDDPATWLFFQGELLAANFTSNSDVEPEELASEAVLFSAKSATGGRALLGGSGRHLTVNPDFSTQDGFRLYFSWSVPLMQLLDEYASEIESKFAWHSGTMPATRAAQLIDKTCRGMENGATMAVSLGTCEFLAKRLRSAELDGRQVTLATPLYVSQMD